MCTGSRWPALRITSASFDSPPPVSRGVTRPSFRFGPMIFLAWAIWPAETRSVRPEREHGQVGQPVMAARRPAARPGPRRTAGSRERSPCSRRAPAPGGRAASTSRRSRAGGRGATLRFGAAVSTPPQPASRGAEPASSKPRPGRARREPRPALAAPPFIRLDSLASPAPRREAPEIQDARQVLFPTVEFAIFFPIVLALSWALMPRQPLWKPFIVVASYVFYAAADPRFCLLLAAITLVSQLAAVGIHRTEDERLRKWITAARRRLRPRRPRRLQVLRLLRHGRLGRARHDRPRDAAAAGRRSRCRSG